MRILTALLVSTVLFAACDSDNDISPEQAALNANRAAWESSGIASYMYTYNRVCFCAPENDIVVVVVDDAITEAFYLPDNEPLGDEQIASLFTIDEFFGLVQQSINDGVASLDVIYNGAFGYPERISIDRDFQIADEEITHLIHDFQ